MQFTCLNIIRTNHYILAFFNTGAYQETIGGFGGLQHCLIPAPKHILIDRDENGKLTTSVFSQEQTSEQLLSLLGYDYSINSSLAEVKNKSIYKVQ